MQRVSLRTSRLVLRRWRPSDRRAFAALNADPDIMQYMPGPLSAGESDRWADRIESEFDRDGFGLWAVELPGREGFLGFTGLNRVPFAAAFTPAVEIGWRLSRRFRGQGYATEAARAALRAGFTRFGLSEIVAEERGSVTVHAHAEADACDPALAPFLALLEADIAGDRQVPYCL